MSEPLCADEGAFEDDGGFHDYTIATALEKLIASVENALRHVLTKDLPRRNELSSGSASGSHMPATYTAHLNHRLPFRSETYSLSLHLPANFSTSSPLPIPTPALHSHHLEELDNTFFSLGDQPNKLQEWFVPGPCIVLAPNSYSGRILDEEEAHTLLSVGTAALSHLKLPWPVCIPVHDALRDAYRGLAIASGGGGTFSRNRTTMNSTNGNTGAVVRFESDSVHSRSLPLEFSTLSGQLKLFSARLRWHAPHAASVCSELATTAADALMMLETSTGGGDIYSGPSFQQREREQEEIEDQNLAAAAEALALSSSPPSAPPSNFLSQQQQRRASSTSNRINNTIHTSANVHSSSSCYSEEELSVYWEMRKSYELPLSSGSIHGSGRGGTYNNNNTSRPNSSTSVATASSQLGGGGAGYGIDDDFELVIDTWDDEAVWRPWAAEDDPIERLEIDAVWSLPLRVPQESSSSFVPSSSSASSSINNTSGGLVAAAVALEHGGEPAPLTPPPPDSATTWRLAALRRDYQPDDGRRPLILLQSVDQRRHFLRLQSVTELPLQMSSSSSSSILSLPSFQPPVDALPGATSFAGMLNTLLEYTPIIINAPDTSHLTSDEWWLQNGNYVPPLTPSYIVQDAIRDVFQALSMPPTWPGTGTGLLSEQLSTLECFQEESRIDAEEIDDFGNKKKDLAAVAAVEVVGKGAPLNSLISRLALHALRLGNPRAISMLWTKFLRELRFAHWEADVPLPRMTTTIDSQQKYCILHQKLQTLDLSIRSKMENPAPEKECGPQIHVETPAKQEIEVTIQEPENESYEGYSSATEHSSSTSSTTANTISSGCILEGEKTLHFLETLPPAAVHAELLAVGFASAFAILSRAPAAKELPVVAAQLERVKELGNAWLGDHGVSVISINNTAADNVEGADIVLGEAAAATAAAAAGMEHTTPIIITPSASESNFSEMTTSETDEQQHNQPQPGGLFLNITSISPAVHDMIHSGLGTEGMKTLVQILACVEQTIAAGQSILQRLDTHYSSTITMISIHRNSPSSSSSSSKKEFAKKAANALIAKALEHGSGSISSSTSQEGLPERGNLFGTIIEINAAEYVLLTGMASRENQKNDDKKEEEEEQPENEMSGVAAVAPFWNEWCISITKQGGKDVLVNPLHRLFVRKLPAELRVATVITSEMSYN